MNLIRLFYVFVATVLIGTSGFGQGIDKDLLIGKWIELTFETSDSCNIDSLFWSDKHISYTKFDSLFLITDTTDTVGWNLEFFENGEYMVNDHVFCNGTEFKPSGKWSLEHSQIKMIRNNPCKDSTVPNDTIDVSHWLSSALFFECLGKEDENGRYILIFYLKVVDDTK